MNGLHLFSFSQFFAMHLRKTPACLVMKLKKWLRAVYEFCFIEMPDPWIRFVSVIRSLCTSYIRTLLWLCYLTFDVTFWRDIGEEKRLFFHFSLSKAVSFRFGCEFSFFRVWKVPLRRFKKQLRLRQIKFHSQIDICKNVQIVRLFPISAIIYCWQNTLSSDWLKALLK